jgi:hypothetical protein
MEMTLGTSLLFNSQKISRTPFWGVCSGELTISFCILLGQQNNSFAGIFSAKTPCHNEAISQVI